MSISRVRCATALAITPYRPMLARRSENAPNEAISLVAARCGHKTAILIVQRVHMVSRQIRVHCGSATWE